MPDTTKLRALLVTGTDTGVGKTYVAACILQQLREDGVCVGAYKPVCSGATILPDGTTAWDDIARLELAINGRDASDMICPQRFRAPLAPPVAARLEQRAIDSSLLVEGVNRWHGCADAVVIEGVGGWLCPVTEEWTVADLAARWQVPVLIVARRGLGTINHTLLTIESIRQRGLPIAGVVLNEAESLTDDDSVLTNLAEIERRSGVPVLAEMLHDDATELRRAGEPVRIRWWELMSVLSVVSG